jgi:hypothetical protein
VAEACSAAPTHLEHQGAQLGDVIKALFWSCVEDAEVMQVLNAVQFTDGCWRSSIVLLHVV